MKKPDGDPCLEHSDSTGLIALSDIVVGDRARKEFSDSRSNTIEQLAVSIYECGLIHPIILNDRNELVAGERRMRAFMLLNEHYGETYAKIPYNLRENIDDVQLKELELEENMQRKQMTWAESVLLIHAIHSRRTNKHALKGEKWGVRQTGQLLSVHYSSVANACRVAEALLAGHERVSKAGSLKEALIELSKDKEEEAIRKLHALNPLQEKVAAKPPAVISSAGFQGDNPLAALLKKVQSTVLDDEDPFPDATSEPTEAVQIPLSEQLFNIDCIEFMRSQPPGFCDHIITDIPYGIDMANLEELKGVERVEKEHDVEENVALMEPFLQGAFHSIKENGYLMFYYDLTHHEKIRDWAIKAGFKVQMWPNLWIKTHPCKNNASGKTFTKAFDPIFVARKGGASLARPQNINYHMADGMAEKRLQMNPFAKPFAVNKWLLDAVGIPGQTIYDPFAGEGSILRTALNCGYRILGTEISELHYPRLVEHIKKVYRDQMRGEIEFV